MGFDVFEHTADLGLLIWADSEEGLFEEAGRALTSVVVPDARTIREEEEHDIDVPGTELDYLLFDWLNELLYHLGTSRLLFRSFKAARTDDGIRVHAAGEPIDPRRHPLEHEVKAITYHGLTVIDREASSEATDDFPEAAAGARWLARVIIDI